MSHRTCGKRCHDAQRQKCKCWCGGLFHGQAGHAARVAFVEAFGAPIPDRDPRDTEPLLHWPGAESRFNRAMECAIAAHARASCFATALEAMH
jgi:hypothetical protein